MNNKTHFRACGSIPDWGMNKRHMSGSFDRKLDQLVDLLGWDREVAVGFLRALSSTQSNQEANSMILNYLGPPSEHEDEAIREARRLIEHMSVRERPSTSKEITNRSNEASKSRNAGDRPVLRPSDDEIKQAFHMGVNVRTKVKRSGKEKESVELARKVVNCLKCGKVYDCRKTSNEIIAFLNARGRCTFCGAKVRLTFTDGTSNDEDEEKGDIEEDEAGVVAAKDINKRHQPKSDIDVNEKAEELRRKLIEFDRHSAQRTTVIDDQSDFFEIDSNAWLSEEERQEMRKRQEEEEKALEMKRRCLTVTVDLLGRRVIVDGEQASPSGPGGLDLEQRVQHGKAADLHRAMKATAAESPQGGGTAARQPSGRERMTVSPGMEQYHYAYLPKGRGRRSHATASSKGDQKHRMHRVQDDDALDDVFALAAAEIAAELSSHPEEPLRIEAH